MNSILYFYLNTRPLTPPLELKLQSSVTLRKRCRLTNLGSPLSDSIHEASLISYRSQVIRKYLQTITTLCRNYRRGSSAGDGDETIPKKAISEVNAFRLLQHASKNGLLCTRSPVQPEHFHPCPASLLLSASPFFDFLELLAMNHSTLFP